jgi:magnesium-protoporphyrin O-methyltransferase
MRAVLLARLPADLSGRRVLDAGAGAGQLAIEAARRGADVVAVDLARTLLTLAEERLAGDPAARRIRFVCGDMFDPALGAFDHVVAMDSLIHYAAPDIVRVVEGFAARTRASIVFTFAPKTPLLTAMHAAGKLFPRGDRAPAIAPVAEADLRARFAAAPALSGFDVGRSERIKSGFYISNAMELIAK